MILKLKAWWKLKQLDKVLLIEAIHDYRALGKELMDRLAKNNNGPKIVCRVKTDYITPIIDITNKKILNQCLKNTDPKY